MASTLISESDFRPSISSMIERQFDLDEFLTLTEEYSTPCDQDNQQITAVSEASKDRLIVNCMSTETISTVNVVDPCAVCMDSFHSGETGERVPCGHVYHASCITAWLSACNSCPLCRSRISPVPINFRAPENNEYVVADQNV